MRSRNSGTAFLLRLSAILDVDLDLQLNRVGAALPASDQLAEILRLRMCFRFAIAHAPLRMTNWKKDRLGLQIAVQFFGKFFHLFQFFVEVFGQESFAQLLQVRIEGHTQG